MRRSLASSANEKCLSALTRWRMESGNYSPFGRKDRKEEGENKARFIICCEIFSSKSKQEAQMSGEGSFSDFRNFPESFPLGSCAA